MRNIHQHEHKMENVGMKMTGKILMRHGAYDEDMGNYVAKNNLEVTEEGKSEFLSPFLTNVSRKKSTRIKVQCPS